jgi:hypothetical protein
VADLWAYLVRQKNGRLGTTLRKCTEKDRGAGLARPYPVPAAVAGIVSRHTAQNTLQHTLQHSLQHTTQKALADL